MSNIDFTTIILGNLWGAMLIYLLIKFNKVITDNLKDMQDMEKADKT
jgi:hypothetical protein